MTISGNNNKLIKDWIRPLQKSLTIETENKFINTLDLKIQKTILFRMTGCPNGCTRPYMAELSLVGSGQNKYQLWLGGSKNLQRLAKPFLQRMELNDLEKTLQPLFDNWKRNLDLDFGDFINTQDENYILNLLNENQ